MRPDMRFAAMVDAPLFMTRPPPGANSACDALAAIIDDEDGVSGGRRKRGLGEIQVHMALTAVDDFGSAPCQKQQRQMATEDAMCIDASASTHVPVSMVPTAGMSAAQIAGFNAGAAAAAMAFTMPARPWACM